MFWLRSTAAIKLLFLASRHVECRPSIDRKHQTGPTVDPNETDELCSVVAAKSNTYDRQVETEVRVEDGWSCWKSCTIFSCLYSCLIATICLKMDKKEKPKREPVKVTSRIWFSVFMTAVLCMGFGFGQFVTQAIDPDIVKTYGISHENFLMYSFAVIYITAFISAYIAYSITAETRKFISLSYAVLSVGFALQIFSGSLILVFLSKAIVGVAMGIKMVYMPCYLSDIAPKSRRSLICTLANFGALLGYLLYNLGFFIIQKYYKEVSLALCAVYFVCVFFVRFCEPHETSVTPETSIMKLLKNKKARRSLILMGVVNIASCFGGVVLIVANAQTFFKKDFRFHLIFLYLILAAVTSFIGWIYDIFGKKWLLVLSSLGVCALCLGIFFGLPFIPLTYCLCFVYAMAMGPSPNILVADVFPPEYKSPGALYSTLCNFASVVLGIAVDRLIPSTPATIVFSIYAVVNLLFAGYAVLLFKETSGMPADFQ